MPTAPRYTVVIEPAALAALVAVDTATRLRAKAVRKAGAAAGGTGRVATVAQLARARIGLADAVPSSATASPPLLTARVPAVAPSRLLAALVEAIDAKATSLRRAARAEKLPSVASSSRHGLATIANARVSPVRTTTRPVAATDRLAPALAGARRAPVFASPFGCLDTRDLRAPAVLAARQLVDLALTAPRQTPAVLKRLVSQRTAMVLT